MNQFDTIIEKYRPDLLDNTEFESELRQLFPSLDSRSFFIYSLTEKLRQNTINQVEYDYILHIYESVFESINDKTQVISKKDQTILVDDNTNIDPNSQNNINKDDTRIHDKSSLINEENDQTELIDDKTRLMPESDKTQLKTNVDNTVLVKSTGDNSPPLNETVLNNDVTIKNQTSNTATVVRDTTPKTNNTLLLKPGSVIKNRFVLTELLGQGGMGSVFKAIDKIKEEASDSNPYVAIKFLNEDFKRHPQSLISLQREAKKSQTLAHPNIVTVYDFDRDGDTVYMTMEHMDGEPLDKLIRNQNGVGFEIDKALKILEDISQALAYAHKNNLVHSDLKPGNVFVTNDGNAKVLDFGIARAVKHSDDDITGEQTMFDAGDLGGLTPAYASLEMLLGEEPAPADDIYALACIACELFTGQHPYNKLPADKAANKGLVYSPPSTLDKKQRAAILHALNYKRANRTSDAKHFIEEFFIRKQSNKAIKFSLAIAAILLIAIGSKIFFDIQNKNSLNELILSINNGEKTQIEQGLLQVSKLNPSDKDLVLVEVRDKLINYYANQSLPLVDQSKGQYQFPKALNILEEAKQLFPDSAQISILIDKISKQKDALLSTLSSQINIAIEKGNLDSEANISNIKDIIELVRSAEPNADIESNQQLKLAISRETKQALNKSQISKAEKIIKHGYSLFPNENEFSLLDKELEALKNQIEEDKKLAKLQRSLTLEGAKVSPDTRKAAVKRHKEKLTALLDSPFSTDKWLSKLQSEIVALNVFSKGTDADITNLKKQSVSLLTKQAKKMRQNDNFNEAKSLIEQATKILPKSKMLNKEKRALKIAQRKLEKKLNQQETKAKINSLRHLITTQAKANDVKSARQSLEKLEKLTPDNKKLIAEARSDISNAYIRLAERLSKRNQFADALGMTKTALKHDPSNPLLLSIKDKYAADLSYIKLDELFSGSNELALNEVKASLKTIRQGKPENYQTLQNKLSNKLFLRIQAIADNNTQSAKHLIDQAITIFPNNVDIQQLKKRSNIVQSSGGQDCKLNYAGHGKRSRALCFDLISKTTRGPILIVIPGMSKTGTPLVMGKFEVSIKDFNHFCQESNRCNPRKSSDLNLPITNIDFEKVKQYLSWLSDRTGKQYHLPQDAQWLHAAHANGKNQVKDYNCRLMLGNEQIKGFSLVNIRTGKSNAWGMVNHIGNAQELVERNNKMLVRGGSFKDSFSQCNVNLVRTHNGKRDSITSFRVAREF